MGRSAHKFHNTVHISVKSYSVIEKTITIGVTMGLVNIKSEFPNEDVIALKQKSGMSSVEEAILAAIYHYLNCDMDHQNEAIG